MTGIEGLLDPAINLANPVREVAELVILRV